MIDDYGKIKLIAIGTLLNPNPDKIILTQHDLIGHIYRNFKRYVIIKDIFDNAG